jgi:hypothetical protein
MQFMTKSLPTIVSLQFGSGQNVHAWMLSSNTSPLSEVLKMHERLSRAIAVLRVNPEPFGTLQVELVCAALRR